MKRSSTNLSHVRDSNEDIRLVNDDVTLMQISVEPDQPVNGEEAQPATVATSRK